MQGNVKCGTMNPLLWPKLVRLADCSGKSSTTWVCKSMQSQVKREALSSILMQNKVSPLDSFTEIKVFRLSSGPNPPKMSTEEEVEVHLEREEHNDHG